MENRDHPHLGVKRHKEEDCKLPAMQILERERYRMGEVVHENCSLKFKD